MTTGGTQTLQEVTQERDLLNQLVASFSAFQSRFDEVHKAPTVSDALTVLADIFIDALGTPAIRALKYEKPGPKRDIIFTKLRPGVSLGQVADDESLVDWAVENGNVMLIPVEDEALIRQGLRSQVIMPIKGKRGYAVILMWVDFGEKTSIKFYNDLLQNASREFAILADGKELLTQVQAVRELMDNIIESVPQGIFAIDRNDRIVACNRDIEILFGIRRVEAYERRYQEVFSPAVVAFLSNLVISTLNGEESSDHELSLKSESGPTLTIGVSTSLLYDTEGKPHGLVFICRDLSLSLEVQRLREIDVMKSEFIHTVSHELKTPLTAIIGGAELLMALKGDLPEECQSMVEIIDEGGKRLHTLIMDLLDLSRLESGRVAIERQVTDLIPPLMETVELLKPRNPKVMWDLKGVPASCVTMADPMKIKQAFENLVGNAVKYSPEGGLVSVRLSIVGDEVIFEVEDHGLGIPSDQQALVWDKFYRVDSSTTAEIEGTGLGLPIVKHVIEMHGGRVTLESSLGEGSTFGFRIPCKSLD